LAFSAKKQRLFHCRLYALWQQVVKTFIILSHAAGRSGGDAASGAYRGGCQKVVHVFMEAYISENPDAMRK